MMTMLEVTVTQFLPNKITINLNINTNFKDRALAEAGDSQPTNCKFRSQHFMYSGQNVRVTCLWKIEIKVTKLAH
jgi:hypothetical protein